MPVTKRNGKWYMGSRQFESKAAAVRAYRAYRAKKGKKKRRRQ